jgi:hypothetical protein
MKQVTGMKRKFGEHHMMYIPLWLEPGGGKLFSVRCNAKLLLHKVRRERVG